MGKIIAEGVMDFIFIMCVVWVGALVGFMVGWEERCNARQGYICVELLAEAPAPLKLTGN